MTPPNPPGDQTQRRYVLRTYPGPAPRDDRPTHSPSDPAPYRQVPRPTAQLRRPPRPIASAQSGQQILAPVPRERALASPNREQARPRDTLHPAKVALATMAGAIGDSVPNLMTTP